MSNYVILIQCVSLKYQLLVKLLNLGGQFYIVAVPRNIGVIMVNKG